MAFFPCVRFEDQVILFFRGDASPQKKWTIEEKINYSMKLHQELNLFYSLISKLVLVSLKKGFGLIIENPYSQQHYLTRYWCVKPALIDKDRSDNGDYYKKPTQFWFINAKCYQNIIFEPLEYVPLKKVLDQNKVDRSMIHPQYASRFIRQYILSPEQLKKFTTELAK